ncbi:hypothetical protein [Streptomyces ipomoeae]|uniref:hypothetical protein n=1 Tax=Streptomyces ipomoeae TaxID=103232 RepID=UPI00114615FA|nr:hypothetical protein [Streptomyces ipomoeae]TQE35479.1 hypothetical protein Sipo7851_14555 [Streptomyces ipomoeae]
MSLPPDLRAALFYDGTWNDISRDLRATAPVTITRGADGESGAPGPMAATCQLDNRHRRYSPRSPRSPQSLFNKIGRNTPIRLQLRAGGPWARHPGGFGGTDDRLTTPDSAALDVSGDLDVRVEVALDDWQVAQTLAMRYKIAAGNQRCWILQTTSDGTLILMWSPDGTFASRRDVESTEPVPAHRGQRLAVRAVLDINNGAGGHTVRFFTARNIDDPEKYWTQLGDAITGTGTTGVHTGTAQLDFGSGSDTNTNANPAGSVINRLTGTMHRLRVYDGTTLKVDLDLAKASPGARSVTDLTGLVWTVNGTVVLTNEHIRMAGEVPAWPPQRHVSGNDVYTEITPAGITRRLGAGKKPLDSALLRYIRSQQPLECWPLTDGDQATSGGSLYGSPPLAHNPVSGRSAWSKGELADWIEPVVQIIAPTQTLQSLVPNKTAAEAGWSVDWFKTSPAGEFTSGVLLVYDRSAGTDADPAIEWSIGQFSFNDSVFFGWLARGETANTSDEVVIIPSGAGLTDGLMHHFRMSFEPSGSSTLWWFYIDGELIGSGTAAISTATPRKFLINTDIPDEESATWSTGYVTYWGPDAPSAADIWNAATGFQGETAGTRALRLAEEAGQTLSVSGADDGQVQMGIQRRQTLLELLETCAVSEHGYFLERRDEAELVFRAHTALENQVPAFVLDFSAGMISEPFKPLDDDKLSLNDVTVRREGGTVKNQQVLETGRMSVLDPPDGIGRYDQEYERNVASDTIADQIAGWDLHVGTFDGLRFVRITIDLANPRVHQMIDHILRADVGDLMRLTNLPEDYPADDVDLIIRGYQEEIGPEAWKMTFTCEPGEVWTIATVAADDPVHDGLAVRADLDSELAEDISATATSFEVRSTGETTWIDTTDFAAQFPFDVRVGGAGGEVMRVTACTSAVLDTFTRTAASSWGTADVGGTWTTSGGSASDFSVGSGVGTHTHTTVGVRRISLLTAPSSDFDIYANITTSATATGSSLFGMVAARYTDVNNQTFARVEFTTANAVVLSIRDRISGTETQLGTFTTRITHVAGTFVRARFKGSGTSLKAKVWQIGEPEPGAWQIEATSSAPTVAGSMGLWSTTGAGNTNVNPAVRFDNLNLANPQTFTVTRGINGYSRAWESGDDVRLAITPILPL